MRTVLAAVVGLALAAPASAGQLPTLAGVHHHSKAPSAIKGFFSPLFPQTDAKGRAVKEAQPKVDLNNAMSKDAGTRGFMAVNPPPLRPYPKRRPGDGLGIKALSI